MKKITQYRGKAESLRHTISSNNGTTFHIALFALDNQKIMLKMVEPIFLDSGDEIIVIGWMKNNLFHGIAYNNLTKQIAVKATPVWLLVPFIIIFFAVGLVTAFFGIGLIFLGISFYAFYVLKRNLHANKMINHLI